MSAGIYRYHRRKAAEAAALAAKVVSDAKPGTSFNELMAKPTVVSDIVKPQETVVEKRKYIRRLGQ